jgi:hypothetical protein
MSSVLRFDAILIRLRRARLSTAPGMSATVDMQDSHPAPVGSDDLMPPPRTNLALVKFPLKSTGSETLLCHLDPLHGRMGLLGTGKFWC